MASKPDQNAPEGLTEVGRIVGAFGLRGQLKVQPLSNIASRFEVGKSLILDGEPRKITEARLQKSRYILRLEGIKKIDEAEALQWKILYVEASDRPDLDEDEYMVEDLIGLRVVTSDGRELGNIDEVLEYPAHDLLVVGKLLIPAVHEFVEMVDFDQEIVVVKLLEGMEELAGS